ncbi:MAG: hypothetical protein EBS90_07760 [Betaproteobacteria bacterium]|nr:hypothetical protein [Betaproteobacteria bacterium]
MPTSDIIDRAHELLESEYESEPTDDVIRGLIAEVLALRGVAARSDAAVLTLVRANGRWSTLAGFLYGVLEMTCDGHAMKIAQKKWEEAHAKNHD